MSDASARWHAEVLTIFPDMFPGPLGMSLAGQALEKGTWSLGATDIRDFAIDRHGSVDDSPFGGGAGMVMRPDVIDAAIQAAQEKQAVASGKTDAPLIYFTPRGVPLSQTRARELAGGPGATLICGRFEGVDQRVFEAHDVEEISLGDYVLSGGELAALVLLDAVVRLLPGVVGKEASLEDESFESGLLEYPHYTRPQVWEGREVPEVLLSGHHAKIDAWRREQAAELTKTRRPDVWARYIAEKGQ